MSTRLREPHPGRLTVAEGEADFQRALGRVVVAGARLDALAPGGQPITEAAVRESWTRRRDDLLARRDDILASLARDSDASSMLRMRAPDGSIVAVDATELESLATRMLRHRSAGVALGFAAPPEPETETGASPSRVATLAQPESPEVTAAIA